MKKRRKNKGQSLQNIKVNVRKEVTTKEIKKVIYCRPKGAPNRDQFSNDLEGKIAYKEARKEFWENNPMIKKEIIRVKKIITYHVDKDLQKLLDDPKRASKIQKIKTTIVEYNSFENKPSKYLMKLVDENGNVELKPTKKVTVVSSISLLKVKRLTRLLNHNWPTNTKISKAIKVKRKNGAA